MNVNQDRKHILSSQEDRKNKTKIMHILKNGRKNK